MSKKRVDTTPRELDPGVAERQLEALFDRRVRDAAMAGKPVALAYNKKGVGRLDWNFVRKE